MNGSSNKKQHRNPQDHCPETAGPLSWVAFALQVLGDEMLAADAALDPSTAHYVPPVTGQQVSEFYQPVQSWLGRAAAAKANPAYTLTVALPAVLPPWVARVPCPLAHLLALRQAVTRIRDYTDSLLPGFEPGPQRIRARDIVPEGIAAAGSAADYGNRMWGPGSTPPPPAPRSTSASSTR